jgi:hypothetical protein
MKVVIDHVVHDQSMDEVDPIVWTEFQPSLDGEAG